MDLKTYVPRKFLHSVAYRVGESRFHISDIDGYRDRLDKMKVWSPCEVGIGNFHVAEDIYRLVHQSVAETVALSGHRADAIDHVIVCSSQFGGNFAYRNRKLAAALIGSNLDPRGIRGICGGGCTDVLCGIDLASHMLDLGAAKNVLLIGMEAYEQKELLSRLWDYALISDAAVSFIVSKSPGHGANSKPYEILSRENIALISRIGGGMSTIDAPAYACSATAAAKAVGLGLSNVTKVFGNNTFSLIKMTRESLAGFSKQQVYLENVERLGHCLTCDSILNLVDYGGSQEASHFMLFAEAEGHSSTVLIRGCPDHA